MKFKAFYRLGKIGFVTVIWFFSYLVAVVLSSIFLLATVENPERIPWVFVLTAGAIVWYIILYIIISILFRIVAKRMNLNI